MARTPPDSAQTPTSNEPEPEPTKHLLPQKDTGKPGGGMPGPWELRLTEAMSWFGSSYALGKARAAFIGPTRSAWPTLPDVWNDDNSRHRAMTAHLLKILNLDDPDSGHHGSLPDELDMPPQIRCGFELLEAAVREVPFRVNDRDASVLFYKGPGPRIFVMNAASVFPEQSDLWYTALVEQDLPRVAACLYTGISDLPFLRRAGAQLHAAGGTHFMLLARDALADLFPIHRDWLAHLAVLVLHAAWHGIGAWHRDTFPTIQFPEATDLVFSV